MWERYLPERTRDDDPVVDPSQPSQPSHPAYSAEFDATDATAYPSQASQATAYPSQASQATAYPSQASQENPPGMRDATDATDATDELQGLSRAHLNGNGSAPRTLFEEFGSEDGIVNAIVETFDGVEIAEPEVRYLTPAEIAAWLEVSPQEFANMCAKGKIGPVGDAGGGKRSRWLTADLRALRPGGDLPDHPDHLSDSERERASRYREAWPWLVAMARSAR